MGVARHRHLLCVVGSVKLRQFDDVATGGWKLVVNLVDSVLKEGINFGLPKNQLAVDSFEYVAPVGTEALPLILVVTKNLRDRGQTSQLLGRFRICHQCRQPLDLRSCCLGCATRRREPPYQQHKNRAGCCDKQIAKPTFKLQIHQARQ